MKLRRIFVLLALAACEKKIADECGDLLAKEQNEAAVAACTRAYEKDKDPRAGHRAAYALFLLGRGEEALVWVDRLRGTPREAAVLALAARTHSAAKRDELSRASYERCVTTARASGDDSSLADCLFALFHAAWHASKYGEAMRLAEEAVGAAKRDGDRDLQRVVASAMYSSLYSIGDLDAAEAALDMYAANVRPDDRKELAHLAYNRGALYVDRKQYALARDALAEALALATPDSRTPRTAAGLNGDEPGRSSRPAFERRFFRSAHINLAIVALELGDLATAENELLAGWEYVEEDGGKEQALLYYFARIQLERGELSEADKTLRLAFGENPVPDWIWDLEYLAGLLAEKKGDTKGAIAAFERSIVVVEEMRRSFERDALRASLEERKRAPYNGLFLLHARASRVKEALAVAERSRARTFLDALHRASRIEPKLLPAAARSTLFSGPEAQRPEKDRHVFAYYDSGEDLWLFVLAGEKINLLSLGRSRELVELVDRFAATPDDRELARRLGDRLFPRAMLPKKGAPIHVIPDGALASIPFAALELAPGEPVILSYPLTLVPSLSALAEKSAESAKLVIIADAKRDLPEASAEAHEVAARLGVKPAIGEDANSASLFAARGGELLHVATHSGVNANGGFVELSDGTVDAATIIDKRINPKLVVLASCASAATKRTHPWGSTGAAFLAAGSQAVVASLWSVNDRSARELVREFYREGGAIDSALALAKAQRTMIAKGVPASTWASFVHLGVSGR
jgi:tetratricopeptide (TPR) repeat protein